MLSLIAALAVPGDVHLWAEQAGYQPPHDKPGPASEVIRFTQFPQDAAPLHLAQGDMDLYLFGLSHLAAREIRENPDLTLYEAFSGINSIVLNPAPAPEGQLNPFSIKKVRQAVQLIINREFIAQEFYGGFALPMLATASAADPDYMVIYDILLEAGIRYDPERARLLIEEALTEAGAQKVDGIWHYNGQPITLKFIIRVEDERRDIGDLVASELEKLGFKVERLYMKFGPAIDAVYGSDPREFKWHLYTEGWGKSALDAYDYGTINQFYAPWYGYMPGWQEAAFWNYENPKLDELGRRLYQGQYASRAERDEIYRQMTELGLDESVRIFVVTRLSAFPTSKKVQGLTRDLGSGLRGPFSLREAYVEGQDVLTVGHLWVHTDTSTWNPVGGFGDVYSIDIWRIIYDPATWAHPFSGRVIPFRVIFEDIETAGPAGKLTVPPDAVRWDAVEDVWVPVGEGVEATSRVVYDYSKYFQSVFHHGQPITMADLLYSIAQNFEIAFDPQKKEIESAAATTLQGTLEPIVAYRVLDENRIEVYLNYWHFDDREIAGYGSPGSISMPWELLAAMDRVVFEKRQAAYSDTAAERFNVPWLSLVLKDHAQLVADALREMQQENFLPEGYFTVNGQKFFTPEEAQARYEAALKWFEEYGHLVISQGPYQLVKYDPEAQFAELKAFRHETYPFKPGDWYFGQPQLVEVQAVAEQVLQPHDVQEILPIGWEARFSIALEGPGQLQARYALRDTTTGDIVTAGRAEVRDGRAIVTLPAEVTGQLAEGGLYELLIAANSDQSAVVAEHKLTLVAEPYEPPKEVVEKVVEKEVPVEKVVEKVVEKEVPIVPVWMWAVVGVLALLVVLLGVRALRA
jgi:peptide/nickel transport system substrate-binding protein